MWKNSVPLATSRPGLKPQRGAVQEDNKNIPMRMRERRVERGQKELAGLQHNKNEIGLSSMHMEYVTNGSSCS